MAEVAAQRKIEIDTLPVRTLILSGEPGGSIPSVRSRIEEAWQAKVVDHAGATEVGPWGYPARSGRGLHILESEFIAEFLSLETGQPASEGELSELVLTNLGRVGSPVIRYRTGDLVRPIWQHDEANRFVILEGGVLGRTDDMTIIRGVNIFPSAVEQILRSFPEVLEFRMIARKVDEMDHDDRSRRPAGKPCADCRGVAVAAGVESGSELRCAGDPAAVRGQRQSFCRRAPRESFEAVNDDCHRLADLSRSG